MTDEHGQLYGAMIVFRDVTLRQRAEEELARAEGSRTLRARVDAIERQKLDLYQRRYAEYVRVAKALQALMNARI